MKIRSIWVLLAVFFLSLPAIMAQNKTILEKEISAIDQRAKEIAPFLSEAPTVFGAPWSDRKAWKRIASLPGKNSTVKAAENLLKTPIKDIPEDLYKEFYKNGNRSNYQRANGFWYARLETFAIAEGIEHKGRFIPALEEIIQKFCDYPSWVLPAHDRNAVIFDKKVVYSDLVSTAVGQVFGIILSWSGNELSRETTDLMRENIEKRVLEPYRICVKEGINFGGRQMWWIRGSNNWNSVCHAGTIGAALTTVQSKQERAWFIAAAEYFTNKYFFPGFTNDGYCSEGMGYWNYGFGNFVYLAAAIRQATGDKINLFTIPKVIRCTEFAPKMEVAGQKFAAFADCGITAKPAAVYMSYLSRVCGLHLNFYEKIGSPENAGYGFFELAYLLNDPYLPKSTNNAREEKTGPPIRSEFDIAGVLICRPQPEETAKTLAVAMKAGHNNEQHNHNDIGSYSLAVVTRSKDGTSQANYMVLDPGGETYTRRTFSNERYTGELLNSFGHPVPRVNGKLQIPGGKAKGVVLDRSFSDELDRFAIDMTSAYAGADAKSVKRTFTYYRTNPKSAKKIGPISSDGKGAFVIEDEINLNKIGTFDSALITFQKTSVKKSGDSYTVAIGEPKGANGIRVLVTVCDEKGNPVPAVYEEKIVGENDASVRNKPTRLGFGPESPLQNGLIRFVFLP